MTRLITTVAVSALVLGFGAPVVRAADTAPAHTQTQSQMQGQMQGQMQTQAPADTGKQDHRSFRRSAQWQADHSANQLNREELARTQTGGTTSYGSRR